MQLLTESVLLSLGGGALGLGAGYLGVRALVVFNPGHIPRVGAHGSAVMLDWRVLTFVLLTSVFTGVLFGLIPALNASRVDLSATFKESSSQSTTGMGNNRARSLLVIIEIALALVLLVGAGLLIRTVKAMHNAASVNTRIVLAPSGRASAVIKRDPMKPSQNIDNILEALASLIPLSVINVVDQAATDASIGT